MRLKSRFAMATIAVLFGAAFALPVLAQTATTGIIEGTVKNEKGEPIADATLTGTAGQAPFTALTDAKGRYVLPNLPSGSYNVRAEAPGRGAVVQEGVSVKIGSRTQLDFILNTGITEAVTVTSEAPIIDAKSTTIGGTFVIDEYVNYVPLGRNFTQTFTLAPGVADGGGTGAGNYSISGASGLENSYVIDGVNITNTGYGGIGSYNIVYGSLGTGVTSEYLEEVQVKTGGFEAEYGQATGGVVNAVVKSGTNNFEASVAAYYGEVTQGFKQVHRSSAAVNFDADSTDDLDVAVHVGGPIIKDKLFYFGTLNRLWHDAGATIEPLDLATPFNVPPATPVASVTYPAGNATYPTALAGPQLQERSTDNWAAKVTWYANPNHRVELSGFGDPSDGEAGPQAFAGLRNLQYFTFGGGQSEIEYGANNYTLKYDGALSSNFFLQAQVGRHDGTFREVSTFDATRVRDRRQELAFLGGAAANSATWFTGGTGFLSNADDVNNQFKIAATWVLGNHELKGGIQYDDIEYTDDQAYTGPSAAFVIPLDGDGDGGYTDGSPLCPGDNPGFDCHVILNSTSGTLIDYRGGTNWRSVRARFYPTPPPTTTEDLNFFVQDTWSFHPRWTLKAGVRVTSQEITGSGGFTLPLAIDPGTGARIPVTTPYNADSYKFDTEFAPRVGVTWDVQGDGRTKVYANVARYLERIPNDLAVRSLSNEVGISRYQWTDFDYITGVPLSPAAETNANTTIFMQGLEVTEIEEGTKLPYVDELLLGFQRELGNNMSIEIRGIYREQGRALEDVQYTSIESIQNFYYADLYGYPEPFPAFPVHEPFGAYVLANPGENTQIGPNGETIPKATHEYKAAEFILNKRFGNHWLFYGNFRISDLEGNYEGLYRNDNGQSDPNITSLFDFPLSPLTAAQFEDGQLNTDRPFMTKLFGSYKWDSGFVVGGSMNWMSGTPRTPLLAHPIYQNAGELPGLNPVYAWYSDPGGGPVLVTGPSTGPASDPNFVAGPFLFDYDNVGRGALGRTPDIATFDLLLGYDRTFGKAGTLQLGLTVFNLFGSREVNAMDDFVESTATIENPDFNTVLGYQNSRSARLSARWTF